MSTAGSFIGHDAMASLLQLTPDRLERLVGAGVIRRSGPQQYVPAIAIKDYIAHLHAEPDRRERAPTQAEMAEHLDMSERNLRDVLALVKVPAGEVTMAQVRVAYIRRLREQAAGRDDKLSSERAALARSQREGQEIKNAVARKEFAPIAVLGEVLGMACAGVSDRMDALRGDLRRRCPDMSEAALSVIDDMLSEARDEWTRSTSSLVVAGLMQLPDEDPLELDELDLVDDDDLPEAPTEV